MHSRWVNAAAKGYYVIGLLYYLYRWLFVFGTGGLVISTFTYSRSYPYITFFVALIASILLLVGIFFWLKQRTLQLQSHNPGLEDILLETVHVVLASNNYRSSRRLIVKALHDGVDHYQNKFSWTGQGDIVPVIQSPHRVSVYKQPRDIFMVCRVDFERPLKKGEQVEFTYTLELADHAGTAAPFLSHKVYYRTARLIQRVRFDPPTDVKTYKRQLMASPTADIPVFEEQISVPVNSNELFWDVSWPRIGYRYKIIW